MALRITIDIFSGRPNPILELSGKQAKEALERLRPAEHVPRAQAVVPLESRLGYRGLVVEQVGSLARGLPRLFRILDGRLLGQRLSHRATDDQFEEFIARSGRLKVGKGFEEYLRQEMARARRDHDALHHRKRPHHHHKHHCHCAPLYEPAWWNDGWAGQKQQNNNCYNYSTNYRTDTYAQPGRAAGAQNPFPPTCANVRPAAVADSLIDTPSANNKCPKEGHLVALVISPGWDYHWYRKGRAGYWTHKMGNSPATDVDNSGNLIPDPRTANRGSYTIFCTFMVVMHGHIKIR